MPAKISSSKLFRDLSRYPETSLPSLIQGAPGTGVRLHCAAGPVEELQEVFVAGALVGGGGELHRPGWVAASQLAELLPDLPVEEPVEKRVEGEGGVRQPGDPVLQVLGRRVHFAQQLVNVEDEVRKPANEKLANDDHQSEGGLAPAERPVTHCPPRGVVRCRDDGRLTVDGVGPMLQLAVGPQGQRSMLAGGNAGHLVHVTVHGKYHNGRQTETGDAEDHGEHPPVVAMHPVQRAVGGTDGAQATVVRPAEYSEEPQAAGGNPNHRQHCRCQLQRHPDLVAHGVHDVVVALHADGRDGEDGGGYEDDVDKDVELALRYGEAHAGKVRRGGHDPKRHEQDGAQQVHGTQVSHKCKFPEVRGLYDNNQNSGVGQKG